METKRLQSLWTRKMGWSQWPVLEVGNTVILGRWWDSRQKRLASLGPFLPCGRREDLELLWTCLVIRQRQGLALTVSLFWSSRKQHIHWKDFPAHSWDFKLLRARWRSGYQGQPGWPVL